MARNRILIIKLSSFGDIFHALPAVNNLKVALDAEVDWVTQPEYVELVKCFPIVSSVIPFPRRRFWAEVGGFIKTLRARDYDHVIDLQGLLKSALVARCARGRQIIGPSFQREGARLFYNAVAGPRNKDRHAVEESFDAVRYLGLPLLPPQFPVKFPAPPADGLPSPRVGVVPLSRRENKNWPESHFAETLRGLREEFGASVYLFGSGADAATCERLGAASAPANGRGAVTNLAGRTSLVEMGGWFSSMDVVVVNDSGPLHLAAALGVPTVTMFGPTDPARTGPYGEGHRVVTTEMDCRPCFDRVCRYSTTACMKEIPPERVLAAVRDVLGKAK